MSRNPLAALLRIRGIRERQARADLGHANAQHEQARQTLRAMKTQLRNQTPPHELLTPQQLEVLRLQGIKSVEMLREAADAYEAAEQHRRQQAEQWRRASADRDAAEKLDQRRREEAAKIAVAASERALDDLVISLRHRRSR